VRVVSDGVDEIVTLSPMHGDDRKVGGRAVVEGLPAGSYVANSGQRHAEFTVPGTSIVRLE